MSSDLAEFCTSSVPKDASIELVQLYACKDASNCFMQIQQNNNKTVEYNQIQNKNFQDALDSYNKKKQSFEDKYNRWNKRIGEFAHWAKYDGKSNEFWSVDTDGTCWWGENWPSGHEWCHNKANEKGYDGENYWAKQWGWCYGRYGNFLCKKDDNVVSQQLKEYNDLEPKFTDPVPTRDDFPQKEQIRLDNVKIQCCSNYLSGNADIADNVQTCNQNIINKINELSQKNDLLPAETPITESTITQTPITQTPITQTPITESTITQTPITESTDTESPVTYTDILSVINPQENTKNSIIYNGIEYDRNTIILLVLAFIVIIFTIIFGAFFLFR